MTRLTEYKYAKMLNTQISKLNDNLEKAKNKIERKKNAYLNKKITEYKRKCANEIRKLEWKEERVYKVKKKPFNLREFAMSIAQENAKLRDTDENGRWYCVSCGGYCSWEQLAWGHRFSRWVQNICLDEHNINAQCHSCNWKTWPMGNTKLKSDTNAKYDMELERRYWKQVVDKLHNAYWEWYRWYTDKYDYEKEIVRLIVKNNQLWKSKNFFAPKKNWEKVRNKYVLDSKNN